MKFRGSSVDLFFLGKLRTSGRGRPMAGPPLIPARIQASPLPARFVAAKPWRSRAQPLYKLTSEFGLDGEVDFLSFYYGFFVPKFQKFFHKS